MKGIFIQQPFEITALIDGDSFYQGDSLPSTLRFKNHSQQTQTVANPRLELVVADLKKVKQKVADAFTAPMVSSIPAMTILPQQTAEFSREFALPESCVISDKSQTLYLLYGMGEGTPAGQLPVPVLPHPHLQKVFELLESVFQFVLRDVAFSKGWVVGRFKPSSARQYSLVEELSLKLRRQEAHLAVQFEFKVKRFDTELTSIAVKKGKLVVEQSWFPQDYLLGGEHLNYQRIEERLREALNAVATEL